MAEPQYKDTYFAWAVGAAILFCLAASLLLGRHKPALSLASEPPGNSTSQPSATQPKPALTVAQEIGVAALEQQLGTAVPTGRGVTVGQAEGGGPTEYGPDLHAPEFIGATLQLRSGPSKTSGHAQCVARILYGRTGLAPGIHNVLLFSAARWMGTDCLNAGSAKPPDAHGCQIFNHSWIGDEPPISAQILRRADYLIDHDDVLMAVGVNNGHATPVPELMASAYNVVAVGQLDGNSSGGYTRLEGNGRCKPDIVAPGGLTSFATPVVTAVMARLLETARNLPHAPTARKSPVIRAVLLAGAEKSPQWHQEPGKPLDEHLGAGCVRFDRSYRILTSGPQAPGILRALNGWDYRGLERQTQSRYQFDLADHAGEVALLLAWNRRIDGRMVTDLLHGDSRWSDIPYLAHFDLRLLTSDAQGHEQVVAQSTSNIDNVQHIYLKHLPPGRYRIEVIRRDALTGPWDYALAWRVEPQEIKPE